jgi:methionine-rich copper-binding protein CopC
MGVPAFLTTAAVAPTPLSYFANFFNLPNYVISMNQSNSFYVAPITVPFNISISYLRFLGSASFTSTTIATSGVNNATGASTAFSETIAHNVVLYTVGTGASSRSLQEVYSTSAGLTWAVSVSQASTSNASNQSITQRMTYPIEGFTTSTFSTQYSVSTSNGPISTTQFSLFSNQKYLDIPFATSLSAGNYWLALNRITGTVGGKNMDYGISTVGTSQSLVTWGLLGLAANVSNPFIYGLGVWTTNVAQTTASIAFNAITMTQSYFLPFVNFINQA